MLTFSLYFNTDINSINVPELEFHQAQRIAQIVTLIVHPAVISDRKTSISSQPQKPLFRKLPGIPFIINASPITAVSHNKRDYNLHKIIAISEGRNLPCRILYPRSSHKYHQRGHIHKETFAYTISATTLYRLFSYILFKRGRHFAQIFYVLFCLYCVIEQTEISRAHSPFSSASVQNRRRLHCIIL